MGKYGNIDGIATLTNDPLALDNINKFNIGDRVMCNDNGVIGTVKKLDIPNEACVVDFDNGEEDVWIEDIWHTLILYLLNMGLFDSFLVAS